jgi:hypothetical protein
MRSICRPGRFMGDAPGRNLKLVSLNRCRRHLALLQFSSLGSRKPSERPQHCSSEEWPRNSLSVERQDAAARARSKRSRPRRGASVPRHIIGLRFQRRSLGRAHSNRASAYGGAESRSAEQRIPRSHSSASLRSRSASARLLLARASLRNRTARRLLMSKIQRNMTGNSNTGGEVCPVRRLAWHQDKIDEGPKAALKGRRASIGPAFSFSLNSCYPRADECGAEAARAS